MHLTTREICERYARLSNWEDESVDAFVALLHLDVNWTTKWQNFDGKLRAGLMLRQNALRRRKTKGLCAIALVSGHPTDTGEHADCVVSVPIHEPDKHNTRTYFKTDGQYITGIFTYSEWLDPTWPYPERLNHKLDELICKGIPIDPIQLKPKPPQLTWPNDGRNLGDAEADRRQANLRAIRERMAEALDADPQGTRVPDLGLE